MLSLAIVSSALLAAPALAEDVNAGPIWNNEDAQTKCPAAAAAVHGDWNGNWKTTIPGQMSVCGVDNIQAQDVNAGPIWNNGDANVKCPVVAAAVNGTWNGQWTTVTEGEMSVCGILF
jgi:hypothetical protein